jgi:CubicO group peptidase (beta-lactamase class C family)
MNKIKKNFAITYLGLFFCWLYLLGCATSPAPITDKSGDSDFAQLLETIRQEEKLPAIAASVIIGGDIYAKAAVGTRKYGTDNWVTIDDKFLIGSCGKAFTATLAAILIEEGFLEWDTTVQDIFPELEMHQKWENITIQQLLSNRSGYADDINSHVLPSEELEDIWNLNSPPEDIRFIYMKRAINHKPIHPPDKVIIYANSGFLTAGVMLEKATEKAFEILMEEKLFLPIKLKSAGYGSPAAKDPISQPHGHSKNGFYTALSQDLPDFIAPMGNVAISIGDWSKFILFHLKAHQKPNSRLLESSTLKKLHTPPNSAQWNYSASYSWYLKTVDDLDVTTLNYALGWFTKKQNDSNFLIGHKGQGSSFTAAVHIDPKSENAILLVTNAKVDHIHLRRAAEAIKKRYALQANLPIFNIPTGSIWR